MFPKGFWASGLGFRDYGVWEFRGLEVSGGLRNLEFGVQGLVLRGLGIVD